MPKLIGVNRDCKPYARTLCAHPIIPTIPYHFLVFLIVSYQFLLFPIITYQNNKGLGVGPYGIFDTWMFPLL